MTFGETVLGKLAEWRPTGDGRHTLPVTDEATGWAAEITVDRQDSVGCQVWETTVRHIGPARDTDLGGWAEGIASRVTGLLEPLKVVEVDGLQNEALLRSDRPTPRGDDLHYYEVRLKGTREATLRRYHGSRQLHTHREQVPFALTHEVLAKAIGDVAGA